MTTMPADEASVSVSEVFVRYEQERLSLLRDVDLLKLEVSHLRKEAEDANARAAMFEAAIDRHLKHCEGDVAAVQRLRAELRYSNGRRKEQSDIIKRREERIEELLSSQASSGAPKLSGLKLRLNSGWLRRLGFSANRA